MEPRIATLLGSSSSDRTSNDLRTLLPPPRILHHVQPNDIRDDVHREATQDEVESQSRDGNGSNITQNRQSERQEPSAPIAGVLNDEVPTPNIGHAASVASTNTLPPFSGRLSDLLLDPSQRSADQLNPFQQHTNKRRKLEEQANIPSLTGSENKLKLPKPTQQLPKKTPKRPRIPPLLQGLHHPPPLPEKVFPPITGEARTFGRDLGERVGVRSPVRLANIEKTEDRGGLTRKTSSEAPEQESPKDTSKPAVACTSDKENSGRKEENIETANFDKAHRPRKRNKWSEQETKDLLVGVSRFGIGSWKKILQCPDFTFNQRTAVDLKDRFRVCCPGDGLKKRKPARKSDLEENSVQDQIATTATSASNSQDAPNQDPVTIAKTKKTRGENDRKGPAELAEMGIHTPFTKHKRRERRDFSEQDDENLLKGFEKYAPSWHQMRDDKELGFSGRHPTDLRDRFRIRYPEKFSKAGYKLKAKDELMLREKDNVSTTRKETGEEKQSLSQESVLRPRDAREARDLQEAKIASSNVNAPASDPNTTAPVESTFRSHALRQPLLNSFPSPIHDFADLASEEDAEDGRSPVILSRNILQWVDANPSQSSASTSTANAPTASSFSTDNSLHFINGPDGLYFESLNMPMSLLTASTMLSATPSLPQSTRGHPGQGPNNPYSHVTINPAAMSIHHSNTTLMPGTATTKPSMNSLLRTPNLPTMMYPPVPVSSARSTNHNLPKPADLLSGMELDMRTETQNPGFAVEDNMFLVFPSSSGGVGGGGYDSSATLAPMVGGGMGQGIFNLDRGLLDERLADRRG